MHAHDFEALVRDALAGLPAAFLNRLENVDVLVEEWPSPDQLSGAGLEEDDLLYGLYEGVPLTEREGYNLALPDRITIFQGPIEGDCATPGEVVEQVRETVVHEVAHYFGIRDAQLEEWGVA